MKDYPIAQRHFAPAVGIFEKMSLADEYPEFLTLPLYEAME